MQFDVVATNPPFQDYTNKKKTQHKLWIEFTQRTFNQWLKPDGILLQVSPNSFLSPSNKILKLMQQKDVKYLRLDTERYFPKVGSTFADYLIYNRPSNKKTEIIVNDNTFAQTLDSTIFYLPNDISKESLEIHKKTIFNITNKLNVKYDYVTCHNILIHRNDFISRTKTENHIHPIFHTNAQVWYSRVRQDWSNKKKVMWSRSGYTKPFYDDCVYGGTDMVYYVLVVDDTSGYNLANNLNTKLMKYIFKTAKWSGFGNEKLFCSLPDLPTDCAMSDSQMYELFNLTKEEEVYVENYVG